jgi:hypothetical protein
MCLISVLSHHQIPLHYTTIEYTKKPALSQLGTEIFGFIILVGRPKLGVYLLSKAIR